MTPISFASSRAAGHGVGTLLATPHLECGQIASQAVPPLDMGRRKGWRQKGRKRHGRRQRIGLGLARFCLLLCLLPAPTSISLAQETALPDGLAVLAAVEQATTRAIARAEKSVVAITRILRDQAPGDRTQLNPLGINRPFQFDDPPSDPDFVPTLFGSGVVVSKDGFIVTCAHVLDDPRQHDYLVWLDKRSYSAKVVGRPAKVYAADPFSDLAILKIDANDLQPIEFGDPKELKKGSFVIALGNPDAIARDGQASASWGIVSNLSRVAPTESQETPSFNKETVHQYGTLIQTDAKLNLGTSGGALINLRGQMVGLTTSLASQHGYERAAGFAIATDDLFHRVITTLQTGKLPAYGFLGIQPEDVRLADAQRGMSGARVSVVIPGLPGDEAGLRGDDVIIEVAGRPILNRNDLFRELSLAAAGEKVELVVQRYRPGSRIPVILKMPAQLSKKFVATHRPNFALHPPPRWQGLTVEYATAVPSEATRAGILNSPSNAPKVAVLSVEPGTPAWEAGLRPGYGIHSVNNTALETPDQFYQLVGQASERVTLSVVRSAGRNESIQIAVPRNEN